MKRNQRWWGLVAILIACASCNAKPRAAHRRNPVTTTASTTPATSAPTPARCAQSEPSLLSASQLRDAANGLAATASSQDWLSELAGRLGVACRPEQKGFHHALAGAVAHFQARTLPVTTDVDGELDDRTRRLLQMHFATLRGEDHPCRTLTETPVPRLLTEAQREQAAKRNGARAGKSEAWIRSMQQALGARKPTGRLDAPTLQRIAAFQRTVRVVAPRVRVDGMLDAFTVEALERAYPPLRTPAPDPKGPEAFFAGCLTEWKEADDASRAFMLEVYETQRIWAAQRREMVTWVADATPIEKGTTASKAAAEAAKRLLSAARASVADEASPHRGGDLQVVFGYRSAAVQLLIWEYHFGDRYRRTKARRERLPGGEHGHEAVVWMAKYYAARTASPGYSLHNRGLALDLACITPEGQKIGPTGRYLQAWKRCWCFDWLKDHAPQFGYRQNGRIDEPWHWEYESP